MDAATNTAGQSVRLSEKWLGSRLDASQRNLRTARIIISSSVRVTETVVLAGNAVDFSTISIVAAADNPKHKYSLLLTRADTLAIYSLWKKNNHA